MGEGQDPYVAEKRSKAVKWQLVNPPGEVPAPLLPTGQSAPSFLLGTQLSRYWMLIIEHWILNPDLILGGGKNLERMMDYMGREGTRIFFATVYFFTLNGFAKTKRAALVKN